MVRAFLALLGCQEMGEVVRQVSGIPLSGPIIGMILLLAALIVRGGASDEFCRSGQTMLGYLSLFFVPLGVGVMQHLAAAAMLSEKADHLSRGIRPARIGVGPGRTASDPCMASAINELQQDRPRAIQISGSRVPAPFRALLSLDGLSKRESRRGLCQNHLGILRVHRPVLLAMEDNGRHSRSLAAVVPGLIRLPRRPSSQTDCSR